MTNPDTSKRLIEWDLNTIDLISNQLRGLRNRLFNRTLVLSDTDRDDLELIYVAMANLDAWNINPKLGDMRDVLYGSHRNSREDQGS